MNHPSREQILSALNQVFIPEIKNNLVDGGLVGEIQSTDGKITVRVVLPVNLRHLRDSLKATCIKSLEVMSGVTQVEVSVGFQIAGATNAVNQSKAPNAEAEIMPGLSRVKYVLAVASGKGGVGKSTVTANLAAAIAHTGARVGVMDTDIYGPSMGIMFGIEDAPRVDQNKNIYPVDVQGLKVISMSMFTDANSAVIWRGPMVSQMVQTFLRSVMWGELDYLLIDLPPGTGDIALTLTQSAPLSGAVIVTTPQEVSLLDVRRGLKMFEKVSVPVVGIVENMSYFVCDGCEKKHYIFQQGGGSRTALTLGLPFLGELPLDPRVSKTGDNGQPIVMQFPDADVSKVYQKIASEVMTKLSIAKEQGELLLEYNLLWTDLKTTADFAALNRDVLTLHKDTHQTTKNSKPSGPEFFTSDPNGLLIGWNQGAETVYPLGDLRYYCPCASCVDEWTGERTIKREQIMAGVTPKRLFSVGRYAMGLEWSDGHKSGIYTYDYLWALAQKMGTSNALG